MSRLRLLKVIVQPVFILDDDDTITEQVADAFTVPAGEWRAFADAGGGFDQACANLAARVAPADAKPEHNGRVTRPPKVKT